VTQTVVGEVPPGVGVTGFSATAAATANINNPMAGGNILFAEKKIKIVAD
jgi:hypothetical protein